MRFATIQVFYRLEGDAIAPDTVYIEVGRLRPATKGLLRRSYDEGVLLAPAPTVLEALGLEGADIVALDVVEIY